MDCAMPRRPLPAFDTEIGEVSVDDELARDAWRTFGLFGRISAPSADCVAGARRRSRLGMLEAELLRPEASAMEVKRARLPVRVNSDCHRRSLERPVCPQLRKWRLRPSSYAGANSGPFAADEVMMVSRPGYPLPLLRPAPGATLIRLETGLARREHAALVNVYPSGVGRLPGSGGERTLRFSGAAVSRRKLTQHDSRIPACASMTANGLSRSGLARGGWDALHLVQPDALAPPAGGFPR